MKQILKIVPILLLAISLFSSCEKPIVDGNVNPISKDMSLKELQLNALVEILKLVKDPEFKEYLTLECIKQKHGDYDVYIKDIVSNFKDVDKYKSSMAKLDSLVTFIKPLVGNLEPIVFYPRAETIEDALLGLPGARNSEKPNAEPLGVLQPPVTNSEPPDGSPAYYINDGYGWYYSDYVSEEYAWENDVYVVGTAENVERNGSRVAGGAEFCGLIQVTDLNAIEHWTSGKLEFKVIVRSATNVEISNRDFDKVKRKHFRNNAWYDYNHSLGNWNTANWGNYTIENWWERDGGGTSSTTISVPAQNGLPGVSYNVNHGENDNSFGTAIVQFTDPLTQVYQISHMNFKRKF